MSEALQTFAFVARRQATRSMPSARWAHVLSLELGWMTPAQARAYVDAACRAGVLEDGGEELRLTSDPATVAVPRGFRPDPEARPEPPLPEDPFPAWLRRVADADGQDVAAVLDRVGVEQQRFDGRLGALPALLLVAREAGLDVRDAARQGLDELTSP